MVSSKLNSKNPPRLNYDNQVLQLLHTASNCSPLLGEITASIVQTFSISTQALLCNVSPGLFERHNHIWCLQLVIFPSLCTSHFQSNFLFCEQGVKYHRTKSTELPRTRTDVEEQGYSASLLEKLLIWMISKDNDQIAYQT